MSISACLLSFNSASTVARVVDAVRPYVDEVVVYDTPLTHRVALVAAAENAGEPARPSRALGTQSSLCANASSLARLVSTERILIV